MDCMKWNKSKCLGSSLVIGMSRALGTERSVNRQRQRLTAGSPLHRSDIT